MNLIVAVDENWGIGKNGDLLVKLSDDLKYFKKITTGKTVIMGRVTFESLPDKRPLPDRQNIVLTSSEGYDAGGAEIYSGTEELLKKINIKDSEEIFVIGGEKVYNELLPYCSKAYITKIFAEFDADRRIQNLDMMKNWKIIWQSEIKSENNLKFQYIIYENTEIAE